MIGSVPTLPPDYELIRSISQRQNSWVLLVRDAQYRRCCLKLNYSTDPTQLQEQISLRNALMRVSQGNTGLLPMLDWGVNTNTGILWEKFPLADDVTGTLPEDSADYRPMTLAEQCRLNPEIATLTVISWGIRLASALTALHAEGFLHLDIKPSNILFLDGLPVLGDYGSLNRSVQPHRHMGSDGYYPPDKQGSHALDVFALGRTLYEVWSGFERYHFPTLPARVLNAPDWESHGWLLNESLIRATDVRVTRRFSEAAQFGKTLSEAHEGRTRLSRRKAAAALLTLGAAAGGFFIVRQLPSHHAVWHHRSKARFGYEQWNANELTCDWRSRMLYCVTADARGSFYQRYDLGHFKWKYTGHPKGPHRIPFCTISPWSEELIFCESVSGQVFRMPLDGSPPEPIPTQTLNQLDFTGNGYVDPIHQRMGMFAGYGNFRVHNRRQEYDPKTGRWEQVSETSPQLPWPRGGAQLFPGKDRKTWFMLGGFGNREGQEGRREAGLKSFTGTFYPLGDFWRLDLTTQQWRPLLGVQEWTPPGLRKAIYHPTLDSVLFLTGSEPTRQAEARFHRWTDSGEHLPQALPNRGDTPPPLFRCWTLLVEPGSGDLWVFADEGIFTVKIQAA